MTQALPHEQPLFSAEPLRAASAGRAYSLIRLFEVGLDQRRWNDFVRRVNRADKSGGVMMIHDSRGAAHAVFAWRIAPSLRGERVLSVNDLVIGSLPGRALCEALIDALNQLALEHDCFSIDIESASAGVGPCRETMIARGFKLVEGTRFSARVAAA
jgi:hypothetical protein